jgi:hypothetical protein
MQLVFSNAQSELSGHELYDRNLLDRIDTIAYRTSNCGILRLAR